MDPIFLGLLILGNSLLIGVFFFFIWKFKRTVRAHEEASAARERELKRKVLELQVLRSLGERVGYSLNIHQILEVICDSLKGLVDFSTVSYILLEPEGRMVMQTHVDQPVSRVFVDLVKQQMVSAMSAMVRKNLQVSLVEETITGVNLDERATLPIGSFFNLPIVIGGQVIALVNVSSYKKGLYADQETAILYTIINQVTAQATKLSQVLENEERRLSAMINSLSDGILMIDPQYNLIISNPSVYNLAKLPSRVNFLEIYSAFKTKIDLKQIIDQSLSTESVVNVPVFELNEKALQVYVEPVKDKYGYLLGTVILLRDMSAQKQLERLREDFTAMMVHELRTPLTTMSYGLETILEDVKNLKPEETTRYLTVIKQANADMLALVNDLLDVARIESGKFEINKKTDDLGKLIEEKVGSLKPLSDEKHINLITEIDPSLKPFNFDRVRMGQALINLVSNSIKYTDSGWIKVSARLDNSQVMVSVADSGDGIKPEDLPKLFSKFKQVGKGKTGQKGGTGLGLVISKGIIESHGGKIWAQSHGAGLGSIFTFTLPLV